MVPTSSSRMLVLILHVDGARLAEFFRTPRTCAHEVVAVLAVDDRLVGTACGNMVRWRAGKPSFSSNSEGTFFTGHLVMQMPTASALGVVHAGGLASHLDLELAHAAAALLPPRDMSAARCWGAGHLDHLGVKMQAEQSRVGKVLSSSHVAADRLVALDQVNLVARLRDASSCSPSTGIQLDLGEEMHAVALFQGNSDGRFSRRCRRCGPRRRMRRPAASRQRHPDERQGQAATFSSPLKCLTRRRVRAASLLTPTRQDAQ